MESRALGKGLSALIPEKTDVDQQNQVKYIKTNEVTENSAQPRSDFDDERLAELVSSIREKGFLQPILVRKKDNAYEVIAGERRLRAAQALGLDKIPVIIKSVSDEEALILALVENIQRQELNAIEEAKAFKRLIDEYDLTQDSVAQSVGKNRTTIANLLRLLRLPQEIQDGITGGILSMGHARALLGIEDPILQKSMFIRSSEKRLSVRELENLIRKRAGKTRRRKTLSKGQGDIYLASIEEQLQRILGTKVRVKTAKKRGKIEIEYYSSDDLERIIGIIKQ